MFLSRLNEREKELFLDLAQAVILSDHTVYVEEDKLLKDYELEMGLAPRTVDPEYKVDVDAVLAEVAEKSDPKVQRIFCMELLALTMVDGSYEPEEREIVKNMVLTLGIPKGLAMRAMKHIKAKQEAIEGLEQFVELGE